MLILIQYISQIQTSAPFVSGIHFSFSQLISILEMQSTVTKSPGTLWNIQTALLNQERKTSLIINLINHLS